MEIRQRKTGNITNRERKSESESESSNRENKENIRERKRD